MESSVFIVCRENTSEFGSRGLAPPLRSVLWILGFTAYRNDTWSALTSPRDIIASMYLTFTSMYPNLLMKIVGCWHVESYARSKPSRYFYRSFEPVSLDMVSHKCTLSSLSDVGLLCRRKYHGDSCFGMILEYRSFTTKTSLVRVGVYVHLLWSLRNGTPHLSVSASYPIVLIHTSN